MAMEFSPPKRSERSKWVKCPLSPEEVQEKHLLVLKPFSSVPHISFHKVKVGCTKSCDLYIQNPLDVSQVVRIEKIPTDKGFYVENGEYSLGPGEEKQIKIFWTPDKISSYRETISFKTSTGCKTHAYLLGTSFLSIKKDSQKNVPIKNKRHLKKKISPKSAKTHSSFLKSAPVFDGLKFCEEKKENIDILNSKYDFIANKPNHEIFKCSKLEPRASFCLKTTDGFPDSPIRRQTYTINSMLSSGRESEVLPFQLNDFCINPKANDTWKSNHCESVLDNNYRYQNVHKKLVSNPLLTKLSNEDLDDSLENIKGKLVDVPADFNDSLTEAGSNYESCFFDISGVKDHVKTYDIASKHLYFGYTPQRPLGDKTTIYSKQFECSNIADSVSAKIKKETFSIGNPNLTEKQMDFLVPPSNFDACNSFSESKINITSISEIDRDNYNHESFSSVFYRRPVSEDSLFIDEIKKYAEKNCYEDENERGNWYKFDKIEEQSAAIEDKGIFSQEKHSAANECEKYLVKDGITGKVLKETKAALCMEFPTDLVKTSEFFASSNLSKTSNKPTTCSVSTACTLKKSQNSSLPLKKKIMASRSVSTSKESSLKSLSAATSKSSFVVRKKENLTKRLPRKLCLVKQPKLSDAVPYQRNPFASMNIYYDERWIEKQEAAFSTWLNFILTPNDDFSSEDIKVDSAKLWIESIKETSSVPAPTKEELSLKAYTATRNLNALRKASFSLYQSENIVPVIKRIEREVDLRKINIRKDRAIYADLGIKKDILQMLLSYNPLWLRIGLETVYGEVITLQNNSDVLGLSRFIVHRFLNNPEISAKFLHPGVLNYYKKGYEDEIQRFIIKKFLLLVFFLDVAKNGHLIKHNPCLFNKNAQFKSSRSLLLAFSRDYFSGEGDITKHLRYLGCKVSYEQTALEEFDFSVRNISVDLRCGLRLGRVIELVLQDWTISQNLRINTLNRLTKIHNNDVILKALNNASIEIENNIEAKHIVDGYREKTLDLLWQIIFKTQISKLINKDLLKKENAFLNRSLKLRADFAAYNALRKPEHCSNVSEISVLDSKLYKENEILQLLFQWCQNVCAHYGIRVHNFTSSFSDGRILCLLLHHYHPNVLPYGCINFETSNSYFEKQMQLAETMEDCPFFIQNGESNILIEKLLKNEQDNLTLVFQKFQEVGHIPILSCPSDMSNTMPDEKVTITLVSYINIRLMELSIEIRAARKILHAWQMYKLRKQHESLKAEIKAVVIIQKAWKRYLDNKRITERNKAARKILKFWRIYAAKKSLIKLKEAKKLALMNKSAICIQALFRGYLTRKSIAESHLAATKIQKYFRRWSARNHFLKLKNIACRIQTNFRARAQRAWYISLCQNVIKLQAYSRGMLFRKQLRKKLVSAVKIQSYVRMWLARKTFNKKRCACIVIQHKFRGYLLTEFCSQEYQNHRFAAISIQKWYRAVKIQQHKKKSIIKIQALVRSFIARKKYLNLKQKVAKIQAWWRAVTTGRKVRLAYVQTYKNVICIQSFIRQCIASQKYKKQKQSAIVIQKCIRAFIAKRKYCRMKKSVLIMQKLWRSKCLTRKIRSSFLSYRKNVILIQSVARCFIAVRNFRRIRQAIISIQKNVRAFLLHKKFCQLKSNAICIQRKWRAIKLARVTCASYKMYRKKVIFIQSLIRKKIAYQSFKRKKHSTIIIQKNIRMFIQRKQYSNLKLSVSLIQKYWRSFLLGRQMRREFLSHRKSAILLQSLYRMYSCRKKFILLKKAVNTVECYRLGKKQRENYLKMKQNAVKLQACFRGHLYRKQYLKTLKNVILIQACIRKFIAERQYLEIKTSVIKIQRFYRGYKLQCAERQKFLQMRNGITKLQAVYRGRCVRTHFKLLNKNAVLIQSYFRRWKAQSDFKRLKQNCLIVQRRYRAKMKMRLEHSNYIKVKKSVIITQAFVRRYLVRKQFVSLKASVIKMQSYFRMIKCRRVYRKMKLATRTIEQYYVSYKEMKTVRNEYLQKRSQAIYIQSKVRSLIARKLFLRKKKVCIMLQSLIRMKLQQRKYLRIRNSIIFVQRYYRNQKMMKLQKALYIQQKKSIIYLQSKIRCMIARKKYLQQRQLIIYLQSKVRCMIARQKYLQQRHSIIYLQSKFRCMITRKKYLQQRQTIIYVQSKVRCMIARQKYLQKRQSIIYLQSKVRSKIVRKKYLQQKQSIIYLQSKVRCMIVRQKYLQRLRYIIYLQSKVRCKIARRKYLQQKQSIIYLQSIVRCMIAQKNYLKQKNACIFIQTYIRMYIQQKKFQRIRSAAIFVQKYYRNRIIMKLQRQAFIQQRCLIISLQSNVRCMIARQNYLRLKNACILIQSYIRMYLQRKKFLKIKNTTVSLQKHYRNWRCMKIQHSNYLLKRQSVIFMQSKFRSLVLRNKFLKQKVSCIKIQSFFRMYRYRKMYLKMREAAKTIQKYYHNWKKMKFERNAYLQKRKAIIFLQSKIRSILAQKNYFKQRKSCVLIQSYFRMLIERKRYQVIRKTAIFLQRCYRNACLSKKYYQAFIAQRNATIYLQSRIRCFIMRKRFLEQKNACILIQSYIRMSLVKAKCKKICKATILIQKSFRNYKHSIELRKNFLALRKASITLQSYFRMFKCHKEYLKLRSATLFIQQKYRAKIEACKAKQHFLEQKVACIKIQSYFRMVLAVKKFLKYRSSSVKIQSNYRSYVARKKYMRLKSATLIVQKYFAAWKIRKSFRSQFLLFKQSTIIIQAAIRRYICKKKFHKQRNAVLTLQKYVTAYMIAKRIQKQYVYKRKCVIIIQAITRGFLVRNNLRKMHISAAKIQAAYRMHVTKMIYVRQKKSAIKIQRYFRSTLLTRKIRHEYKKMQISVIVIQSAFRCHKEREEFLRKKASVIILQAHVRRFLSQRRFNKLKKSVRVIESHYLAYKCGLKDYELYSIKKRSCIKIQAFWKAYALRKKLKTQIEAVVKIQRAFRLWQLRKRYKNMKSLLQNKMNLPITLFQRLWYLYLKRSMVYFQRAARTYLLKRHKAATVIQSQFRKWKIQNQYKELKAAVKIQASWKAYVVRRSITNKKILEARKRIKAADSSEPNKLKNRTSRSLELLFKDSRVSSMMVALQELDACTKLSPKCCERLVASGGLRILIELVSRCNRSLPHMEIIKVTANILLNLAKYDRTVNYVWNTEHSISTILDLMKIFRVKGITIFNKCCSLLSIFCQDPAKVEIMKTRSDLVEAIRSFDYLLKHKQNLEKKQLISKSLSDGSFLNKTVSMRANMSVLQKDSMQIEPDWMLGGNRCREFTDPVTAISLLMRALDLKSK